MLYTVGTKCMLYSMGHVRFFDTRGGGWVVLQIYVCTCGVFACEVPTHGGCCAVGGQIPSNTFTCIFRNMILYIWLYIWIRSTVSIYLHIYLYLYLVVAERVDKMSLQYASILSTIQFNTIQYGVQYNMYPIYNTIRSTIQYGVQYNTIQYNKGKLFCCLGASAGRVLIFCR